MRHASLFFLFMLLWAGCHETATPTAAPGQGPDDGVLLQVADVPLDGTILLPPGAAMLPGDLTVHNSLGSAQADASGRFAVPAFTTGRLCAAAKGVSGTLLMGWLGQGRTTLDARSTAEVLLYIGSSAFTFPHEYVEQIQDTIAASTALDGLAAAVEAALDSGAGSLDAVLAAVEADLRTAIDELTAVSQLQGMRIQPVGGKSGIEVSLDGVDSVKITNFYRRRAAAFVDRLGYTPEAGGFVTDEQRLQEVSIAPSPGVTSLFALFVAGLSGQAPWTPTEAGPFPTPLDPSDATSTTYRVTVVGLGKGYGDFGDLDATQRNRHALLVIQTVLLDVMAPYFAGGALPQTPTGTAKRLQSSLASGTALREVALRLAAALPGVAQKAASGDVAGVMAEVISTLVGDPTLGVLFIAAIGEAMVPVIGKSRTAAATKFMEETLFKIVGPANFVLQISDTALQALHLSRSNNADIWEIEVTSPKVTLAPTNVRLLTTQSQEFRAIVQDAASDPNLVLDYHWKTGGVLGKINDGAGQFGFEYDSNSDTVTYYPEPNARGVDSVEVEVYKREGVNRILVGAGQATVDIVGRNVFLIRRKASLLTGEREEFSAKVDPPYETPVTLYYRWSGTEGFGTLDGPLGQETYKSSVSYTANSEGRYGRDTLSVELLRLDNGRLVSLGDATAEILVEQRKSIIDGEWVLDVEFYTDPAGNERVRVQSFIQFPDVPDALSYRIEMYGSYDSMAYREGGTFHGPPFPSDSMPTKPGGVHWVSLSGGHGPPSIVGKWRALAKKRFGEFTYDVHVTYK